MKSIDRVLKGEDVEKILEDIFIGTSAVAQMPGHKQYTNKPIHRKKKKKGDKKDA